MSSVSRMRPSMSKRHARTRGNLEGCIIIRLEGLLMGWYWCIEQLGGGLTQDLP